MKRPRRVNRSTVLNGVTLADAAKMGGFTTKESLRTIAGMVRLGILRWAADGSNRIEMSPEGKARLRSV